MTIISKPLGPIVLVLGFSMLLVACNDTANTQGNTTKPDVSVQPTNVITVGNYLGYAQAAARNLPQLDTDDFPLNFSSARDTQDGGAATQVTTTDCNNADGQLSVISHEADVIFDNYMRAEYSDCLLDDIHYIGSVETGLRNATVPVTEDESEFFLTTYKIFDQLRMDNHKSSTYLVLDGDYESSVEVDEDTGVNVRLRRHWLSELMISHNLNGEAVSQKFTDFAIDVMPRIMHFSGNVDTAYDGVDYSYHIDWPFTLPSTDGEIVKSQPFVITITTSSSQLVLRPEGEGMVADLDEDGDGVFDTIGLVVDE